MNKVFIKFLDYKYSRAKAMNNCAPNWASCPVPKFDAFGPPAPFAGYTGAAGSLPFPMSVPSKVEPGCNPTFAEACGKQQLHTPMGQKVQRQLVWAVLVSCLLESTSNLHKYTS